MNKLRVFRRSQPSVCWLIAFNDYPLPYEYPNEADALVLAEKLKTIIPIVVEHLETEVICVR